LQEHQDVEDEAEQEEESNHKQLQVIIHHFWPCTAGSH
jgi:hypothetical protein